MGMAILAAMGWLVALAFMLLYFTQRLAASDYKAEHAKAVDALNALRASIVFATAPEHRCTCRADGMRTGPCPRHDRVP